MLKKDYTFDGEALVKIESFDVDGCGASVMKKGDKWVLDAKSPESLFSLKFDNSGDAIKAFEIFIADMNELFMQCIRISDAESTLRIENEKLQNINEKINLFNYRIKK